MSASGDRRKIFLLIAPLLVLIGIVCAAAVDLNVTRPKVGNAGFRGPIPAAEADAVRRGLRRPVPRHALAIAIAQMQALPALPALGTSGWNFIGPARISNGQALYHDGFNCPLPLFRINVSGRVSSIAVGGSDSVLYVGTAGGGIWKTVDGGVNWKPLTDMLALSHNNVPVAGNAIGALAVVPNANPDLDVVYAGTGEGNSSCDSEYGQGVLKSTDGGSTWTQQGADVFDRVAFSKIAVVPDLTNPNNPQTLYATTTWGLFNGAAAECGFAVPAFPGLYRTTNAGASWSRISGAGGSPGLTGATGSATDVVVDTSLTYKGPLTATYSDGICPSPFTLATDSKEFTLTAGIIQNNGSVPLKGKFTLTQTPAPLPGCSDVGGDYTCRGSAPSLNGPGALIGCLSPKASFTMEGTFSASTTFSGTWQIDAFQSAMFTLNGVPANSTPAVYAAFSGSAGGS